MKKVLGFFTILLISSSLWAQKGGPVVFTVAGDTVHGAEFERVYNKNNRTPEIKPTQKELEEYLDLYVKFKLKVKEAYSLGMDTNTEFIKELAGYRNQLAQPYLTDKTVTDKLMKEAYGRMKKEVSASNLMIHLSPVASPADTLKAWNRIQSWRKKMISGEIPFEQMATDSSTDPHGREHKGALGYFNAFTMLYSFENNAYNTAVGGISPAFRTQYGYHILKVNDIRVARKDIKVAHILITINNPSETADKKAKIEEIYKQLNDGSTWEKMLDFSEDFSSSKKGGELKWIKSIGGSIPAEFKDAAYALKAKGDYSKPVLTNIGWHIIKLVDERELPTYNDMKETLKYKISRDSRSELNKNAVYNRIKAENKNTINEGNYTNFIATLDSTSLRLGWEPSGMALSGETLLTIGKTKFSIADFSQNLKMRPSRTPVSDYKPVLRSTFLEWVKAMNFTYEESVLEQKYDDFKYLMQEYRDGILLFELTNKKVWSKASEDTIGLKKYYETHLNDFQWKERAKVKLYKSTTPKAIKKVNKYIKKGWSDEKMLSKVNKKNPLALEITTKTIERVKDTTYTNLDWKKKIHVLKNTNSTTYVKIEETIPSGAKKMEETLGSVISDYQNFLENEWIAELKKKYPISIKKGALNLLFKK